MSNHKHIPPKFANRFLNWFLRDDLVEEVQGDLEEQFYSKLEESTPFQTKLNYWIQVINYLRPFALRKFATTHYNQNTMFRSNILISWRSLKNQKMYSAIKIGGFAIGIAACILISLFIRDELSYDRDYPSVNRIYRVVGEFNDDGDIDRGTDFPAPFASIIKDEFPEIEKSGRIMPHHLFYGAGSNQVRPADKKENIYEEGFAYADQETLDILGWDMVYGNPREALNEPNSMVITQNIAKKYFPDENPIGKTMILNDNNEELFTVAGVVKDHPKNSHLQFNFLLSLKNHQFWDGEQTEWMASNYNTYILLTKGADSRALEEKFSLITEKYMIPSLPASMKEEIPKFREGVKFMLQPISDIHLKSAGIDDRLEHGDIRIVWMFGIVAVFVLIIAAINFINLSTAKSANRAREVGIRKVVGSVKGNLVGQFLTESLLYSIISFILGLILAWILLPYFNMLSAKSLVFPWDEWKLYPLIAALALVIGLLAGLYPAFYLSAFKPIAVLKGTVSRGSRGTILRSSLVVFQFTISIVLIIGTMVIQRQMNYILNMNLGFNKDQVMIIQGAGTLGEKTKTFKDELLKISGVESATISDFLPVSGTKRNQNGFTVNKDDNPVWGQAWWGDADYIKTLGMHIKKGRDFSKDFSTDEASVIINEAMAKELNLDDPVGQSIFRNGNELNVIGVVENFHFESMKDKVDELCLHLGGDRGDNISVRMSNNDYPGLIKSVSATWKTFMPNQPIRFTFLDNQFAKMYDDVHRTELVFTSFAVLAIIVASLGLFALSAFMTEQRRKEISIRLVLGASLKNIFRLLVQNFVFLVVLSAIIATPVAWYFMQKWLDDYIYRIQIGWDIFLVAGSITALIALFTISYQSVRAALANPVNSIRSE